MAQEKICLQWLKNKTINPETNKKITKNSKEYKELAEKCRVLAEKEICIKWLNDKTINPETNRKITVAGKKYKELEAKCLKNAVLKKQLEEKNPIYEDFADTTEFLHDIDMRYRDESLARIAREAIMDKYKIWYRLLVENHIIDVKKEFIDLVIQSSGDKKTLDILKKSLHKHDMTKAGQDLDAIKKKTIDEKEYYKFVRIGYSSDEDDAF